MASAQAPTANFTASSMSGCSPLVVDFQDLSSGNPAEWFWDFGNGATSTLRNPSTTYFLPGTYNVRLTVTNASGSNTLTRNQYITIWAKPSVNFTVNDSTACFPHPAQFTDLSTPSAGTTNTTWMWDFGNGVQSTQQNPSNVYNNSGNFSVTLKVTNDKGCYAAFTKPAYIQIAGGVQGGFTHTQPVVCRPPFNISFTNTSTGPGTLSYYWEFGDGNTSTAQNPAYNYTAPGNYTITMAVTSSSGCSDTIRQTGTLNIQNITTAMNIPDSICINDPLTFINTSTPAPLSTSWNFGDGNTSTQTSPQHTYTVPGTYRVRLDNTYSYCADSAVKTIKALPRPVANFTYSDTTRCQPNHTVNFTDASTNAVAWRWEFGDGNFSTQQNPSHTYTKYGVFTVKLVVTNSSGCTDSLTKPALVRIRRPEIVLPTLPVRGCIPYTINPVAGIATSDQVTSYFWEFGDGNTSTSQTPSHTYTQQGTYTVRLTITTSDGCTETIELPGAVMVGRKPVVEFTMNPNPVCAFQIVGFTDQTNEANEWFWQFGDGSTATVQNPTHIYSDTATHIVTLIATNNGCPDTMRHTITILPPVALYNFTTDCNDRLRFTFQDRSQGATSWYWDFGDGQNSILQNPQHVFPDYGTYTVTLTVTNGNCSHTYTRSIKVINEAPDFYAVEDTICRGGGVQFFALPEDPTNIVNYNWQFGNGAQWNSNTTGSGNYAYHYYYVSGIYTITLTTTDIYGCTFSRPKNQYIVVNGPTVNFTGNNTEGCKGLTATFNDVTTGDGRNALMRWEWDFGDGNTLVRTNSQPVQHTYPNPGTYTVKLKVTDASGCTDSLTRVNYVITTDPDARFISADTLSCPGAPVHFTNQSIGTNVINYWEFGEGSTSSAGSPVFSYPNTGNYSVKLRITDQHGCSDSLTRDLYITVSRPTASFSVNDSVSSCTPFEVQYTNTSQYYVSSYWDLGGGNSTMTNPIQYYITPGIYPVYLAVTSPGGCTDTARKIITVYDTTGSRITYLPLDGCKPLGVDLNAFSPGPMTYTWDFGDGVIETNAPDNIRHNYNFFGEFVPKVIMTDPAGCIIPVSGLDTIRIKGATTNFGWDKRLFCDSGFVNFTDSTTFNDPIVRYNWNFGDGNTSVQQHPVHRYTSPGIYTVTLDVLTQAGCVDTMRVNSLVKVVESPLISIAGDSVICVNGFMNHLGVFDRPDTSVVKWAWQFPNGNNAGVQLPANQQYRTAGNFVVTSIATNSSGCADTATKRILVNPLPVVTLPSAMTVQVGFPAQIPATYSSNTASWTWTPSTGLSCANCPQPLAGPKFNTKYNVAVVDSNGCRNTGEIQVIVICKGANVFVPNTFSPNGDGSNDMFYMRGRGLDRVKSLRIFNRWGEVVFEQNNFPVNNPAYGWDGRHKGNKPQADVYVYQVEVFCENSEIIRFEGNIALIQ
jgi:gliding motility-associated-like protein